MATDHNKAKKPKNINNINNNINKNKDPMTIKQILISMNKLTNFYQTKSFWKIWGY